MALPEVNIGEMDVTAGFDTAIERTRKLLFEPFNMAMWVCIALSATLESCSGPGFNFPSGGGGGGGGGNTFKGLESATSAVGKVPDAAILVPLVLFGLFIGFGFMMLFQWLGARGTMMLTRATATGDEDIPSNWRETSDCSHSYFLFNLALIAIVLMPTLLGGVTIAAASGVFSNPNTAKPPMALIAIFVICFLLLILASQFVNCFFRNLIAPMMWKFNISATEGWQLFFKIAEKNVGPLLLFVVIRMVITVGMGIVNFIVGLMTCCIGFIPIINQMLMAPLLCFERTYSIAVVHSLGPDFAMFDVMPGKGGKAPLSDEPGFPGDPDDGSDDTDDGGSEEPQA